MDITIHPASGVVQQFAQAPIKVPTDSSPTFTPQAVAPASYVPPAASSASDSESQYEATIRQAALSFKNVYAVSDQEFTIFKDATGKYITRYVSLRDGAVTYVPEPTLVKQLSMSGGNAPHLSISA